MSRVDIEAVRRDHPLADVVAASGIELFPRGRGFMAHCPFHEDRTPSMSVDGVPGRFHCFGCATGGDVIDWVALSEGIDFHHAVQRLSDNSAPTVRTTPALETSGAAPVPGRTSREQIFELNEHAWRYFTKPAHRYEAECYLHDERGINLDHIRTLTWDEHPAGFAPNRWRALSDELRRFGAIAAQVIDAGLARPHDDRLIDTYRGRVVVPVLDPQGHIEGFLGRDLTGYPTAPKYLNPPNTATYQKSHSIYWPLGRPGNADRSIVVVEGFIDALAVASTATVADPVFPCSTGGVAVSPAQAFEVASRTSRPVILALDGDQAGRDGAERWRHHLEHLNQPVRIAELPPGQDPASSLAEVIAGIGASSDARSATLDL